MKDTLPKNNIIIPTLNQAEFIEMTMVSAL